jgi:hypothetical protein
MNLKLSANFVDILKFGVLVFVLFALRADRYAPVAALHARARMSQALHAPISSFEFQNRFFLVRKTLQSETQKFLSS